MQRRGNGQIPFGEVGPPGSHPEPAATVAGGGLLWSGSQTMLAGVDPVRFGTGPMTGKIQATNPSLTGAGSGLASSLLLQQQMNAALLAQSMDSTGEVSNSVGSDDLPLTAAHQFLLNMDIPASNFTKAMKFGTQPATMYPQEDVDCDVDHGDDDRDDDEDDIRDDIDNVRTKEQDSLAQISFDTSSDILEQQQAQQQSVLMARFKQLREWQQKQQQMLMQQQQQQLELLREEQERVQRMIAKQREMQWGSTVPSVFKNGLLHTVASGAPAAAFSSPRRASAAHMVAGSRTLTNGAAHPNAAQKLPAPVQSQPPGVSSAYQGGRPVPMLPSRTDVDLTSGELLIDDEEHGEESFTEDGIFPINDPMPRVNDAFLQSQSYFNGHPQSQGQLQGQAMSHCHVQGHSQGQSLGMPVGASGDHSALLRAKKSSRGGNLTTHTQHVSPTSEERVEGEYLSYQQEDIDNDDGEEVSKYNYPRDAQKTDLNHNHDGLDFRENRTSHMKRPHHSELTHEEVSPRSDDNGHPQFETPEEDEEEEYDQDEQDSNYYDVDGDSDQDECQCDHRTTEFDEIPVSGAKKKTFEELLEEELRKEEERLKGQDSETPVSRPKNTKKQFLRKGEGVARFSGISSGSSKNRRTQTSCGQSTGAGNRPARISPTDGVEDNLQGPAARNRPGSGRNTATPVTRGLPPKGNNVNRKVFANETKKMSQVNSRKEAVSHHSKTAPSQKLNLVGKPTQAQTGKGKTAIETQPKGQQVLKPQQKQATVKPQDYPRKQPVERQKLSGVAGRDNTKLPSTETAPISQGSATLVPQDTPSKYSDTDSLGETSFVARLTARAEQEVVDVVALEEFELLEQYADDNASFMSSVSAVNCVLQNKMGAPMPPISKILQPPPTKQPSTTPAANLRQITAIPATDAQGDDSPSDSEDGDSTSISTDFVDDESQPGDVVEDATGVDEHDNTLVESGDKEQTDEQVATSESDSGLFVKPMPRKVASIEQATSERMGNLLGSGPKNLLASVQQFSDSDAEVNKNFASDASDDEADHSEGGMYFQARNSKLNEATKKVAEKRRTSREQKAVSSEGTGSLHQHNGDSRYIETTDDDQSVSDVLDTRKSDKGPDPIAQRINFEDDEAWNDSQCEDGDTPVASTAETLSSNPVIRKSILNRNKGVEESSMPANEPSIPPTSQLVSKLFPKLKMEKPKPQLHPQAEQRLAMAGESAGGPAGSTAMADGVQSRQLRDKLAELEGEIEKFRAENGTLAKLRKEREEGLAEMKKEMVEFEKQKDDELKRLQEFKAEEMKKLKREKKQFEQYQQAMRSMPSKKERDEIETLKAQLKDLQEEMKRKESRWNSSMARLREKCEALTSENGELREEIKLLEKQRLQNWQRRDTAPKVKDDIKKTSTLQQRTERPEASKDSVLPRSANLDLDDSDLRAAAAEHATETGIGTGTSPKQPEINFTPKPMLSSQSSSQMESQRLDDDATRRQLPRKKAVPVSISGTVDKGDEEYEEVQHSDGKVEKIYTNGAREILFVNGTRKQVSADGQSIIVSFFNGDMKQILPDQRVVYYYANAQTTHTTYPDGLQILQFPNQQTEKHYPDGTKEITFPDQTIKYLFPTGIEESIYSDGTVIRIEKNGDKTVEFPNGQREVHTQHYKRREYPDGTVKTVYPDGKQETRYSSGRVRVKDNQGNIVVDKRIQ